MTLGQILKCSESIFANTDGIYALKMHILRAQDFFVDVVKEMQFEP